MDVAKLLSQMAHGRDLKLSNLLLTHDGTLKLCGEPLCFSRPLACILCRRSPGS